ncbi:MAG: signal peptidase I, partial [Propionicimonas sp.]
MGIERMATHAKRTLAATLVVLLVGAVVLVAGQIVGRWQVIEVQGGSMQPTIANGAAVLTTPSARGDLHPGDVVTMIGEDGTRVTHRVVEVDEETAALTTRGDANFVNDGGQFTGDVEVVRAIVPGAGVVLRFYALAVGNPGWILAHELTSRALVARGIGRRERNALLRAHRRRALGFGVATQLCFLVPGGAVATMPAAVAGSTLLAQSVLPTGRVREGVGTAGDDGGAGA